MSKAKKAGIAVGVVAVASVLAGCIEKAPDEKITNAHVQKLLEKVRDPHDLVGKYHVMEDSGGKHLGVVFIDAVEPSAGGDGADLTCVKYNAFTSGGNIIGSETALRTHCAFKK
ncbi:MAG: hypothetical protein MRY79_04875 [Alphaproteobacteria bacterium]|nr:hypothetical protein [Alphaproteobacteria bacterium]